MKGIIGIIIGVYLVLVTYLAYPQAVFLWNDVPTLEAHMTLEAGLSDEQWEFLKDVALLIQYAEEMDYKLTSGEIRRTMYQQRKYVRDGLSWTYNSNHLKALAIDLNLFINGRYRSDKNAYKDMGHYWESLNEKNRAGIRFNDSPHFERMSRPRTEKENREGI